MCWGVPAIVRRVLEDRIRALVDFGDGIDHEVVIGISDEEIREGDTVIVHAGVIISKISEEDLREHMEYVEALLKDQNEE
ncbi:MAG: HypC/HybG/HupF family hydrogenase formation chaperone [Sulfolobales archaeon]|jgi:hydrogenase expression/formation protein HypC